MRPRVELAAGTALLAILVIVAAVLGRARRPPHLGDLRLSTYLAGPDGARGLHDALTRLGRDTPRWRGRLREFVAAPPPDEGAWALALLDPTQPLEPTEVTLLAGWHALEQGGDLILVGRGTAGLMRCLGWEPGSLSVLPRRVARPAMAPDTGAAALTVFLEPDRSLEEEPDDRLCDPAPIARIDTLLTAEGGRVAALRLVRADNGRGAILVSDPDLVRNRVLRYSTTGPEVLSMIAGDYGSVTFVESHHGFGRSGSLWRAVLAWSRRSPLGWSAWQLALVGLLALAAGAVRFGPVRQAIARRRRSTLEHVQALATALGAAKGHDVAIRAMVRGLRRRLLPGRAPGGDPVPWLEELARRVPDGKPRATVTTLLSLTVPGQPAAAVLRAGQAVEDLWEELHPS